MEFQVEAFQISKGFSFSDISKVFQGADTTDDIQHMAATRKYLILKIQVSMLFSCKQCNEKKCVEYFQFICLHCA